MNCYKIAAAVALTFATTDALRASRAGHPFEICIDYGSSGPKLFWCPKCGDAGQIDLPQSGTRMREVFDESKSATGASEGKLSCDKGFNQAYGGDKIDYLKGSGSFRRMSKEMTEDSVVEGIKTHLEKQFGQGHDYTVRVCKATAGNRFKGLKEEDGPGWTKFDKALQSAGAKPDSDGACSTIPGTKEAEYEYSLAQAGVDDGQTAKMFFGIGGASMQLRIPRSCPDDEEWKRFMVDGGVGASAVTDFCKNHWVDGSEGSLWSFLSDRDQDTMHRVGGMDESMIQMWKAVQKQFVRQKIALEYLGDRSFFYDEVYNEALRTGIWEDPLVKFWREAYHGSEHGKIAAYSCEKFQASQEEVAVLSNMKRHVGDDHIGKIFRELELVEGDVFELWNKFTFKILKPCRDWIAEGDHKASPEKMAEFKSDSSSFLCGSRAYILGLIHILAGLPVTNLNRFWEENAQCIRHNLKLIYHAKKVPGDWMNGYLKWEIEQGQ